MGSGPPVSGPKTAPRHSVAPRPGAQQLHLSSLEAEEEQVQIQKETATLYPHQLKLQY